MNKNKYAIVFASGVAAAGISPAYVASQMRISGLTTQPIGHYEFCQTYPAECQQRSAGGRLKLSRDMWSRIIQINDAVNVMVRPRTDQQMWGREEVWSYPGREGDCEDYALEKRRQLMAIGVPASALLMTVVLQPNGDGHAVLTVATDLGDFVLDNLEARVLAWTDTQYRFLKRQSATNSGQWVKINDSRQDIVGSVKR